MIHERHSTVFCRHTGIIVNQTELAGDPLPSAVSVGGLSKSELLSTLGDQGVELNQAAKDLFSNPRFQPRRETVVVRIAALSVSELGFQGGATYGPIVARALELGFSECPLDLAPYLRLQYRNQPAASATTPSVEKAAPSGALTVASKPLDQADQVPKGFYLRHIDEVLWLRGYWSDSSHIWSQEDVFLFTVGKQEPD